MRVGKHDFSAVEQFFDQRLKPEGFDYFAVCTVDADEFLSVSGMPRSYSTNLPGEWLSHYLAERLYFRDPVLKSCAKTSFATDWRRFANEEECSQCEMQVLQDARHFGLRSGIGLSVKSFDGSMQIVSLASRSKTGRCPDTLARLTLGSMQLAKVFTRVDTNRLENSPPPRISAREVECLTWAALGKSSSEIAEIIDLSANTVDFHVKRAMVKLDATSRTFAIVRAMRLGLINP
jgi:LuxR family quorum-sensing system transcriptional regulator CciR